VRGAHSLRRLASLAAILAAAGALAWLAQGIEGRWIWAGSGSARLGDASERLLAELPAEAHVRYRVLVEDGSPVSSHLERLAGAYRDAGLRLSVERLHPDRDTEALREYGLARDGEGLLGLDGAWEHVAAPAEARVSAALERLLRRGSRYVVYLTGRGERSLEGEARHDLGKLGAALSRKGYRLQPLDLASTPVIPDNTRVLVGAGPQQTLETQARRLLAGYLARGGSLLWLTDPGDPPLPGSLPARRAEGVVVDPEAAELLGVEDPRLVLSEAGGGHPVLAGLDAPLLLNRAAPLRASAGAEWQVSELLVTGERQWAVPRQAADSPGAAPRSAGGEPLALAFERQGPTGPQRIAVFGDGDLFANAYLGNGGNLALAVNTVEWLAAEGEITGSYAEAARDQRLRLTRTETLAIGFGFLALLPGLSLLGAWIAWRRGRHG